MSIRDRVMAAMGLALAALSTMAHVGSPDTFFAGTAGPYPVRVIVRLPGVIPGRAQITVRVMDEGMARGINGVRVRAAQWNLGIEGAPPAEAARPVSGEPAVYANELWFMTATSYRLFVDVEGAQGRGTAVVPVLALATAQRSMERPLGLVLAALGVFLTVGMLTIVGAAVRESVLAPGVAPDVQRRRRARAAVAATAMFAAVMLWGGARWWSAEAERYRSSVLFHPFQSRAVLREEGTRRILTLEIRDPRWTGKPLATTRYNDLMPDHGKLMHLFLVREPALDAFAHLHPVARTPAALEFDADVPSLPPGRYRVYGDIVHESGYAQTLVAAVDLPGGGGADRARGDPDDSWLVSAPAAQTPDATETPETGSSRFATADGPTIIWQRGSGPLVQNQERALTFVVQDASGAPLALEPYMGMLAHVAIAHEDGSVFAHLHPAGSISMAAMQRFARGPATESAVTPAAERDGHARHLMPAPGDLSIPYAFPKAGRYRIWMQSKQAGRVVTATFRAEVRPRA